MKSVQETISNELYVLAGIQVMKKLPPVAIMNLDSIYLNSLKNIQYLLEEAYLRSY